MKKIDLKGYGYVNHITIDFRYNSDNYNLIQVNGGVVIDEENEVYAPVNFNIPIEEKVGQDILNQLETHLGKIIKEENKLK